MKRIIVLCFALALLLCGCAGEKYEFLEGLDLGATEAQLKERIPNIEVGDAHATVNRDFNGFEVKQSFFFNDYADGTLYYTDMTILLGTDRGKAVEDAETILTNLERKYKLDEMVAYRYVGNDPLDENYLEEVDVDSVDDAVALYQGNVFNWYGVMLVSGDKKILFSMNRPIEEFAADDPSYAECALRVTYTYQDVMISD